MREALLALVEELPQGVHEHTLQQFELLLVKAPWGELALSRQGAQVLHFRPAGELPVLWLSDQLQPAPAAIRGGIPLCWPWFGDRPPEPAHGVARTAPWRLTLEQERPDGLLLHAVPLELPWPGLDPLLTVEVRDASLEITLQTVNSGTDSAELSQALHTYLAVGDVQQVRVPGLEGCEYLDKLRDGAPERQPGELQIDGALDRIYRHDGSATVIDPRWQRQLQVTKSGSGSTVVWNPGAGAANMVDVGMAQQSGFLCVETANTVLDPVRLAPGERCRLTTRISVAEPA